MSDEARVLTTQQLRRLEASWIKACDPSWGLVLMELAGRQAAEFAASLLADRGRRTVVLCGLGNNGGDGLVVSRYLKLWGFPVTVWQMDAAGKSFNPRNEAVINKTVAENLGLAIQPVSRDSLPAVKALLDEADLIVDALLGTGLDRPLEGLTAELIQLINETGKPVLSIDLPSGVHSDTGQIMGCAVQAVATVTFGYLKAGLLHHPGAALCGRLKLLDIGLPRESYALYGQDGSPQWWLSNCRWVREHLPQRPAHAHKGVFGRLLTVAGSAGMSGASLLASKSALRAGCGLSILATPQSLVTQLPPQEVIFVGLPETEAVSIAPHALDVLKEKIPSFEAFILGPGLSTHKLTVAFVHDFVSTLDKPCVIDADALNALALKPELLQGRYHPFVLTPHPRELSRLIGLSVAEIQADRGQAALKAASMFNSTVVLKGAHTVIATPDARMHINPTGNSAMATAGSGDVLSGIIGGLLAQGLEPPAAAIVGTYLHGAAGDRAAGAIGCAGVVAGDIMDMVPAVITGLHTGAFSGSTLEQEIFG